MAPWRERPTLEKLDKLEKLEQLGKLDQSGKEFRPPATEPRTQGMLTALPAAAVVHGPHPTPIRPWGTD